MGDHLLIDSILGELEIQVLRGEEPIQGIFAWDGRSPFLEGFR